MNDYTFWIPIFGKGDNAKEAWDDALDKTVDAVLKGNEWTQPPEALYTAHEEVPAAEILGGSLSAGFGIDHGPEE